jgi:hypothetical protein
LNNSNGEGFGIDKNALKGVDEIIGTSGCPWPSATVKSRVPWFL